MNKKAASTLSYFAIQSVILFVAFVLRLWNLGMQSLWHDEAWSIFSAYHPLALGAPGIDPNTPPIFYVTLSAWMRFAGDGVWALRFLSLIFGVLTVAAVGLLARRWFSQRIAISATILVALSPLLWVYAQEIRAYGVLPLFSLVALFLVAQLRRSPRWQTWLVLLLVELLALYTHNLAVALVAWINVAIIVLWTSHKEWRHVWLWLLSQMGVAILYLPWLLTQRPTGSVLNTQPALSLATLGNIWQSYFTGEAALLNTDPTLIALTIGLGLIAILAFGATLAWRRSHRSVLLASQALLLPLFEMAIIWGARIDFHPRYFIAGVPALLMLMSAGVDTLRSRRDTIHTNAHASIERTDRLTGYIGTWVQIAMLFLALLANYQVLQLTSTNPIVQHDDFHAIAQYYAKLSSTDAIIIPYGWEPTLEYYASKVGIRAQIIGIPINTPWQSVALRLNALHARHIEVLTWYQNPADLRGMYTCLLSAVTKETTTSYTVVGLTTTGYDDPRVIEAQTLATQPIDFGMFRTDGVSAITGSRSACVISNWVMSHQSAGTLREPFRVTTGLQNPLGWVFTRADADLRDDYQATTQFWSPGQQGLTFSLLRYPMGTPSGQYPIMIGLYGAKSLHSLDVLRNGTPSGQSVPVGTLIVPKTSLDDASLSTIRFKPLDAEVSVALGEDTENAHCTLQPGQQYRISALWRTVNNANRRVELRLRGDNQNWSISKPQTMEPDVRVQTMWYAFIVPAQAQGSAVLEALSPQGTSQVLQTCSLTPNDHLLSEPSMSQSMGIAFSGVGTLAGFDLPSVTLESGAPFTLTLYWRAEDTPSVAYTVFTHLLDASGHVIAQDDQVPGNGKHPTTGWLNGEYIIDPHTLQFNAQGQGYRGAATIEVGLYDPVSGSRALLSTGADHIVLPINVTVR